MILFVHPGMKMLKERPACISIIDQSNSIIQYSTMMLQNRKATSTSSSNFDSTVRFDKQCYQIRDPVLLQNESRPTTAGVRKHDKRKFRWRVTRSQSLVVAFIMAVFAIVFTSFLDLNRNLHVLLLTEDGQDAAAISRAEKRRENAQKSRNKRFRSVLYRADPLMKRGTWDVSPIVIESHKLLFFSVPKIAATTFKQLFRRMHKYKDWSKVTNEGNIPHNPDSNGLTYLFDYSFSKANHFLTSEEWTRAIFVREPKARLVSAYKDKALEKNGWYMKNLCGINSQDPLGNNLESHCQLLAPYNKTVTREVFPFQVFVKDFVRNYKDPHWEPQSSRVSVKIWKQMNFIGRFENLYQDTKSLLNIIGAWDEYGSHGWNWSEQFGNDTADSKNVQSNNSEIFQLNTSPHKTSSSFPSYTTNSGGKLLMLDKIYYNTPEVNKIFYDYYRKDYESSILNFTKPLDFPFS